MGLSHKWITLSFPPLQGRRQKPPVTMCPHTHFRLDSANSLSSQPTMAGDSGKRIEVNYERDCCLSLKHLERFDVTEKTNWSQHTRAGIGRKVCQGLLSITCSHSTYAGNRCWDWCLSSTSVVLSVGSFPPELSQPVSINRL